MKRRAGVEVVVVAVVAAAAAAWISARTATAGSTAAGVDDGDGDDLTAAVMLGIGTSSGGGEHAGELPLRWDSGVVARSSSDFSRSGRRRRG